MLIDKFLYWAVPARLHEWAATNRAKVRNYALAAVLALGPKLVEFLPVDYELFIQSAGGAFLAYVTGRSVHSVVTPWDYDQ